MASVDTDVCPAKKLIFVAVIVNHKRNENFIAVKRVYSGNILDYPL